MARTTTPTSTQRADYVVQDKLAQAWSFPRRPRRATDVTLEGASFHDGWWSHQSVLETTKKLEQRHPHLVRSASAGGGVEVQACAPAPSTPSSTIWLSDHVRRPMTQCTLWPTTTYLADFNEFANPATCTRRKVTMAKPGKKSSLVRGALRGHITM
mmetsp:Transcript_81932/g.228359  ORF Transcript_81932/g.228359 Transcript_81932/m.228359 type:complete len:156 (-) Transcript_81932:144-611(-)